MFSRSLPDAGKIFSHTTASSTQLETPIEVAPNECCVVLFEGRVLGILPGGSHRLSTASIPAISGVVTHAGHDVTFDLVFVIQAPLMGQKFAGSLFGFSDPTTGQSISARVSGEYMVQPFDAGLLAQSAVSSGSGPAGFSSHVEGTIVSAFMTTLTGLLKSGQATVQNLGGQLITVVPEVARLASESLTQVGAKVLAVQSPQIQIGDGQGGFAAAQAGMQLPPNPMQSADAALSRVIEKNNPLNKEYELRVDSGLLGINVDKNGVRLDQDKLEKGVKKKVKGAIENVVITVAFIGLFVAIVAVVGIYIFWKIRSDNTASSGPPDASSATEVKWDGKSTYTCMSGNNVIKNTKAKITSGSGIKAMGNCRLTLQNVDIVAPVAIEALGNVEIVVTGGSLEGTTNSVTAMGAAKITVTGATVKGKKSVMPPAVVTGVP